jgi:hypothetical protein
MSGAVYNPSTPTSRNGSANEIDFAVRQILARVHTNTLVKVVAVNAPIGLAGMGSVDVQPLVNLVDGAGNATPQGTIYELLYFRMQGGTNAIIMDPAVGDIGMAGFCSRDISSVKANKAPSNPGSFRRFSMSDGIFFGGMLNGVPSQYIILNSSGVQVVSPTAITLTAPTITLDGNVATTGTVTNNGHAIDSTHKHVDSGGSGLGGVPE